MFRTFMMIYGDTYKKDYRQTITYKTEAELTQEEWMNAMKIG